ncbi:lysosomal-associated transmembrane protein 4B-like [Ornithodoros turicata]|uniref:lysosomal-associated transmembrane protein 4B-like n=1 Tax=Ornithodoros turicata TaxID=34597 RepID=UPI0031396048
MRYMTNCCCGCCDVRKGTKILSILHLICYAIGLIAFAALAASFNTLKDAIDRAVAEHGIIVDSSVDVFGDGMRGIYITTAVFFAIGVIITSLLVHGAFKSKRNFIFPFLVFEVIILVYHAINIIYSSVMYSRTNVAASNIALNIVAGIIGVCLQVYFYFVILSFYKQLESEERDPHQTVAYAPPGGPMPNYYTPGQGKV